MMKEQLSAFIDGELDEDETSELLRAIKNDPEMHASWQRYHLARAALQGDAATVPASDFVDGVSREIGQLPTVIAPKRIKSGRRLSQATRMISTLAIAASVAAITIIGVRSFVDLQDHNITVATGNNKKPGFVQVQGTRWNTTQAANENELNMYLNGHTEYTPAASVQGLMSYVHVVAYDDTTR